MDKIDKNGRIISQTSLDNLKPKQFSTEYQPDGRGRPTGKTMKTLFSELLHRKMTIPDVIAGAKRKVSIQEATLLKLVEFAFIKNQPWALQELLKHGLSDSMIATLKIEHDISPAAAAILAKVGILNQSQLMGPEQAVIIEGELVNDDTDITDLLK